MQYEKNINFRKIIPNHKIHSKPFPHAKISNLFSDELFDFINCNIKERLKDSKFSSMIEKNYKLNQKKLKKYGKTPAISFHKNRWEELGLSLDLYNYLDNLLTEKRSEIFDYFLQNRFGKYYSNQIFFNFTPPNSDFPIHFDTSAKTWTLAYSIYPQENKGTILYDKNKKFFKESEWKLNSGLAFCPEDNVSWHSYSNPSKDQYRVMLIMNILRPNVNSFQKRFINRFINKFRNFLN